MRYISRNFYGTCPKTNEEKFIEILYQPTCNLKFGNCLQKFTSRCKCEIDCPIFKQTPKFLDN